MLDGFHGLWWLWCLAVGFGNGADVGFYHLAPCTRCLRVSEYVVLSDGG